MSSVQRTCVVRVVEGKLAEKRSSLRVWDKKVKRTFWPGLRGYREHGLENDMLPRRGNKSELSIGLKPIRRGGRTMFFPATSSSVRKSNTRLDDIQEMSILEALAGANAMAERVCQ